MQSYFFKTKRGFNLHYQIIKGILPTDTVFLHGNVASNRWWLPSVEIYRKHAKEKSLTGDMILIEFLGCGKSDAPVTSEDMDLIGFAEDFNDLLKQHGKIKYNIVGHSTGGFIAAAMTGIAPELFSKAVILNSPSAKGIALTGAIKAAYQAMRTDRKVMATAIGATIHNNDFDSDFFNQVIAEDAFSSVQKISYWVIEAFDKVDATSIMSRSTVPTLILFGEHDRILALEASAALAKQMQNATFEIVPGHGHCMNIEDPAAFVKKISEFLF